MTPPTAAATAANPERAPRRALSPKGEARKRSRKKAARRRVETRKMSLNLPEEAYAQLKELANESHRSMTDVIRVGLGLVKIALQEERRDRSLAVVEDEEIVKQILIPR